MLKRRYNFKRLAAVSIATLVLGAPFTPFGCGRSKVKDENIYGGDVTVEKAFGITKADKKLIEENRKKVGDFKNRAKKEPLQNLQQLKKEVNLYFNNLKKNNPGVYKAFESSEKQILETILRRSGIRATVK